MTAEELESTDEIEVQDDQDSSEIVLTDRELAIARGEDPDTTEDAGDAAEEPTTPEVDDAEAEEAPAPEPDSKDEGQPVHDEASVSKAKSLGLTDDDLADFTTPAALRRHVELLERIESLSAKPEENPEEAAPKDDGDEPEALPGLIELSEYTEGDDAWDEKSANLVRHVRQAQERLVAMEQRLAQREQEANQREITSSFNDAVDLVGDERLGSSRDERGRFVELPKEEFELRQKIFAEADLIYGREAEAAAKSGKPAPTVNWKDLVTKAAAAVLPSEDKSPAEKAKALKSQSARRRPVGSQATSRARSIKDIDEDDPEAIANSPEVVRMWNRFQAENGVKQ